MALLPQKPYWRCDKNGKRIELVCPEPVEINEKETLKKLKVNRIKGKK